MDVLLQIAGAGVREFPFLTLQVLAVLGILSTIIHFRSSKIGRTLRFRGKYGIVLGLAGFLLAGIVTEFIQSPSKPYLRGDLLFIAAVLEGPVGGAICAAFILAARVIFGGLDGVVGATIDIVLITAGGAFVHRLLIERSIITFNWKDAALLTVLSKITSLCSILVVFLAGLLAYETLLSIEVRRLVTFPISFILIYSIFSVFRKKAADDEAAAIEHARLRHDASSGLPNRLALREYLEELRGRFDGRRQNTLLLIRFADISDTLLRYGDRWLNHLGESVRPILEDARSDPALNARCFLFSDLTVALVLHDRSIAALEKDGTIGLLHAAIRDALERTLDMPALSLRFAAADINDADSPDIETLLQNLGITLHEGNEPVLFFHRSLLERARQREQVRQLILSWIAKGDPPMMYQPQCELATQAMIGAEALLRARSGDGSPLPPPTVLAVAESYQLIAALEWAIVAAVVADLAAIRGRGCNSSLAVNISAVSLQQPNFAERLLTELSARGVPCTQLCVEVVETSKLPDIDDVSANLRLLREAGVSIALDDFGNGYAALSLLAKHSFDKIKLDWSMTSNLANPRMRAAVGLSVEAARRNGATLVAEGIETPEQLATLRELGVEYGQGFLFARAIPLDQLADWNPATMKQGAGT